MPPEHERRIVAERLLDTVLGDGRDSVAQGWADEAVPRAGALERGEVAVLDSETAIGLWRDGSRSEEKMTGSALATC